MKKFLVLFITLTISILAFSQDMTKFKLYSPGENADQEIEKSIKQAKTEGKHVFIQIGGNWCIWCARFNDFITNDKKIDSIIHASFIVYHLNYSKENFNGKLLAKYGYPQRFGFPVFLVLDGNGKLIHMQNSWYLEDGKKSYDRDKVIEFFTDWTPLALDPKQYTEQ
jgi:thioredoxin-related protein